MPYNPIPFARKARERISTGYKLCIVAMKRDEHIWKEKIQTRVRIAVVFVSVREYCQEVIVLAV